MANNWLNLDSYSIKEFVFDVVVRKVGDRVPPEALKAYVASDPKHLEDLSLFLAFKLAKSDVDVLVESKVEYLEIPASGLDWLKTLLQSELQFGWLKPKFTKIPLITRQTIHRQKLCPHLVRDITQKHIRFLTTGFEQD